MRNLIPSQQYYMKLKNKQENNCNSKSNYNIKENLSKQNSKKIYQTQNSKNFRMKRKNIKKT